MDFCRLCPHACGANRRDGSTGFCGAGASPRVFRWGPHFGEEPPLVGEGGSGCVFFSRCTMKCLYCQNSPWSWNGKGDDISVGRLTGIFRELAVKDRCRDDMFYGVHFFAPLFSAFDFNAANACIFVFRELNPQNSICESCGGLVCVDPERQFESA